MVRKIDKTTRNVGIGAGIIVVVLLMVLLWPSAVGPFGLSAKDSRTGTTIANSRVTGTLYGLVIGGDLADWSDYVALDDIADLDEITAAKLAAWAADYSAFFLNASATNAQKPWLGYHGKWFSISTTGAQVLNFEATPTSAGAVLFTQSFVAQTENLTESSTWGLYGDARAVGNFSVSVGINNTDIEYCAYGSYFDYQAQENAMIRLVFDFNCTVDNNDLGLVNTLGDTWTHSVARYNTSAISFECASFTQISTLDFIWDDDVDETYRINEFLVIWEPAITTGATTVLFASA